MRTYIKDSKFVGEVALKTTYALGERANDRFAKLEVVEIPEELK